MDDPREFGRAIAYLRGGRTQAEVSERAGIDPGTWSQYETGRRRPRARNLARILNGLQRTRADLEEAIWQLRRPWVARRLAEELAGTRVENAKSPENPQRAPSPPTWNIVLPGSTASVETALRNRLQDLLAQQAALANDFLTLLLAGRR
jgi:transcriptional regulator with XRE-family HTH domain